MLDLPVLIRPCPKQGERYRPWVVENGGRAQFPFLVDPNDSERSRGFYESAEILEHLFDRYGSGTLPRSLRLPLLPLLTTQLGALLRLPRGVTRRASRAPAQPLELFGFEADPGSRLVRERLCELELPYLLRNCARGSSEQPRSPLPRLLDPNSGRELTDPRAICRYLEESYAVSPFP